MKKSIVKREHLLSDGYGITPNYWLYDSSIRNELGILIQISSLTAGNGVCTASNEWFADKFNLSTVTISRAISKLKSKNYINVDYERRGAEVTKRKIRLSKVTFDGYQDRRSTVINIDKESVINIDKDNSISNNKSNNSIDTSPQKETITNAGTPFETKTTESENKAFLAMFTKFYNKYKGTRKTLHTEYIKNLQHVYPLEYKEIIPLLEKGLDREKKYKAELVKNGSNPPFEKSMKNWIRDRDFENIYPDVVPRKQNGFNQNQQLPKKTANQINPTRNVS